MNAMAAAALGVNERTVWSTCQTVLMPRYPAVETGEEREIPARKARTVAR